jgi:hypothetical protein
MWHHASRIIAFPARQQLDRVFCRVYAGYADLLCPPEGQPCSDC